MAIAVVNIRLQQHKEISRVDGGLEHMRICVLRAVGQGAEVDDATQQTDQRQPLRKADYVMRVR
jgi:hypothetical protein